MKDYELRLKVMNAPLLNMMSSSGIKTPAELSRLTGVDQTSIGRILNLKTSAFTSHGKVRASVSSLCDFFGVLPEDIYPQDHIQEPLLKNEFKKQVSKDDLLMISESKDPGPLFLLERIEKENSTDFDEITENLPERTRDILKLRFDDCFTIEQIGMEFDISKERVRQIIKNALRKIRRDIELNEG